MIKYDGLRDEKCDMCGKYIGRKPMYIDNKKTMKGLFPEIDWKSQLICEPCAKRETGNKQWNKIKRSK